MPLNCDWHIGWCHSILPLLAALPPFLEKFQNRHGHMTCIKAETQHDPRYPSSQSQKLSKSKKCIKVHSCQLTSTLATESKTGTNNTIPLDKVAAGWGMHSAMHAGAARALSWSRLPLFLQRFQNPHEWKMDWSDQIVFRGSLGEKLPSYGDLEIQIFSEVTAQ